MTARFGILLTLCGLPGLFALLAVMPAIPGVPPLALLVQPAAILLALAFAGSWAAPRCGFALLAPQPPGARLAQAGSGLLLGLLIAAADHLARGAWQAAPSQPPSLVEGWTPASALVGLLYGGVVEEVMLRWGFMSLMVLALWRLLARRAPSPPGWSVLTGIVLAALAFAAAHLPALALAGTPLDAGILARTLLLNGVAGLLFGWLFARRDLLAAMLAHAAAHLGFALTALAVAGVH